LVCNKATIPRHMHWHTGPGTLKRLTALAKASILLAAVIRERQKVLCLFSMNKIKNSYACCLKTDTCFWFSWSVKWLQIPAMDLKVTTLSSLSATTVVHLSFLIKSLSLSLSIPIYLYSYLLRSFLLISTISQYNKYGWCFNRESFLWRLLT
jgi:hypothetical protein